MIWISHKAKDGGTLASIVKQYKIKDQNAILKYSKNKKVSVRLKKGEALKKGEVVWVLNPKTKAYVVSDGKRNVLLDERGYKATVKEVHRVMDRALEHQRINFYAACDRHNAQIEINNQQRYVYTFINAVSRAEDPRPYYTKAAAAYKTLAKTVSGRDYKGFKKALVACDAAVVNYNNAVIAWVHGLIDATAKKIKQAGYVRAAGEFATCALILTACPPAGLGAGIVLNATAATVTGLAFDGYDAIGREIAGEKQMSTKEISERMVKNAITGAAAGLIVGGVVKLARPYITTSALSPAFLKTWSERAATRLVPKGIINAELKIAAKVLEKRGGQLGLEVYIRSVAPERLLPLALRRFATQLGTSAMLKVLSKMELEKLLLPWLKSGPKELMGEDNVKLGKAAAKFLMDAGLGSSLMETLLKRNMDKFREILRVLIIKEMEKAEKSAA
ncbi:hypothetical protein [Ruegeria lacuscaerulensis]|uniref:hypothetical protein n=1 Tax=Ruegeria lacuscaerulensis TaxID=55218 RepID=UPI00147B4119|nr:hypothetical protein [Ruegeria lacuscaerulensis]